MSDKKLNKNMIIKHIKLPYVVQKGAGRTQSEHLMFNVTISTLSKLYQWIYDEVWFLLS